MARLDSLHGHHLQPQCLRPYLSHQQRRLHPPPRQRRRPQWSYQQRRPHCTSVILSLPVV